jgi:hypothetical protein
MFYEDFKEDHAIDEMIEELKVVMKKYNYNQIKRLAKVHDLQECVNDDIKELFDINVIEVDNGFDFSGALHSIKNVYQIKELENV